MLKHYKSASIAISYGDAVDATIMDMGLRVLSEVTAKFFIESLEIGENFYKFGENTGIDATVWEKISCVDVILKTPHCLPAGRDQFAVDDILRDRCPLECRRILSFDGKKDRFVISNAFGAEEMESIIRLAVTLGSTTSYPIAIDARAGLSNNEGKKIINNHMFSHPLLKVKLITKESEFKNLGQKLILVTDNPDEFIPGKGEISTIANIGDKFGVFSSDLSQGPSSIIQTVVLLLLYFGYCEDASRVHSGWRLAIDDGYHTPDFKIKNSSLFEVDNDAFTSQITKSMYKSTANAVSYKPQIESTVFNSLLTQ
jgi:hypothetical protein